MFGKKKPKPKKEKKPPLGRRFGSRIRTVGLLGADAVRNPRGIPNTAHGAFRAWLRRIWDTRGGGLYTLGYALTFAALELKTLAGEIVGMGNPGDFVVEQLIEFFIRFGTDSIANLVMAFMWPVFVVTWYPPVGVGLFVLAFALFPRFIRPPIERWLLRDEREPEPPAQ
jgi:hypothetical protein